MPCYICVVLETIKEGLKKKASYEVMDSKRFLYIFERDLGVGM